MPPTVSLIADVAITRLDALDTLARAAGSAVTNPGTSSAHVVLTGGGIASVDIPKFGEAPPLAIDVSADTDPEARAAAERLLVDLGAATDWSVVREY
jgi:hypothetical protein